MPIFTSTSSPFSGSIDVSNSDKARAVLNPALLDSANSVGCIEPWRDPVPLNPKGKPYE